MCSGTQFTPEFASQSGPPSSRRRSTRRAWAAVRAATGVARPSYSTRCILDYVHARNVGSGGMGPSGYPHSGEIPAFCRARGFPTTMEIPAVPRYTRRFTHALHLGALVSRSAYLPALLVFGHINGRYAQGPEGVSSCPSTDWVKVPPAVPRSPAVPSGTMETSIACCHLFDT